MPPKQVGYSQDVEDLIEESAWVMIDIHGWVASPELLFAIKDWLKDATYAQKDNHGQAEGDVG